MSNTIIKSLLFIGACCVSLQAAVTFAHDPAAGEVSLTGTWFRFSGMEASERPEEEREIEPALPVSDPPLKTEYLDAWQSHREMLAAAEARGEPLASNYTHCMPGGMPSMMVAIFPMEILETPGQVTILQEAFNEIRRIYLDEEQMPWEQAEPRFWGHSVAYWQDDVLHVNTVGIKENIRFRDVPHSRQMIIEEELELVTPNVLENRVTLTDPEYLTEPWTWTWKYQREAGYKMYEYVCEDNREFSDPETGEARLRLFDPQ